VAAAEAGQHDGPRPSAQGKNRIARTQRTRSDQPATPRRLDIAFREAQYALDGIVTVDARERIVSWNDGAERLLGHPRVFAIGRDISLVLPSDQRADQVGAWARGGGEPSFLGRTIAVEALHAAGHLIPVEVSLSRWYDGSDAYYTAVFRDITERRIADAEQQFRVTHDPASGLGNITALRQQAPLLLAVAAARELQIAALSVDVAGLHDISRTFGSRPAERMLAKVACALRELEIQGLTPFHLGGSLFAVLFVIEDAGSRSPEQHLQQIGERVADAVSGPFDAEGDLRVELDGRVGIAYADAKGIDLEALFGRAAGARGTASRRVILAVDDDGGLTRDDLVLLGSLRAAIAHDELEVHYQPLVRARSAAPADQECNRYANVEALVRWRHPTRGLLSPDAFIPAAEQTPLIHALTVWVLREALAQQQRWAAAGIDVRVSVNLSPSVLANANVPALVEEQLAASGCPANRLALEITESAIVENPVAARAALAVLRATGVHVSLDDFGTGYTSFTLLRTLDLDEVKLDQTFVMRATQSSADEAIVASVVDLAHRLGLEAVAEGVEDEATHDLLVSLGYDLLQGYLFARPMPAAETTCWLAANGRATWGAHPAVERLAPDPALPLRTA
jgi:PAS domain S-box-containing protein